MKVTKLFAMATIVLLLSNSAFLHAQVTIGADKVPEVFSLLELISNEHDGLRLPQMTTEERDAMADADFRANPEAMGLQIFNTTTHCVETWSGFTWISTCVSASDDGNIPVPVVDIPLPFDCGVPLPDVKFMAYNLGADPSLNTAKLQMKYLAEHPFNNVDAHVYGGLYQWGRKDLPYTEDATQYLRYSTDEQVAQLNAALATYDGDTGQILTYDGVNAANDYYVFNADYPYDWRSAVATQRDDLWGNGQQIDYSFGTGASDADGVVNPNDGNRYQKPVKGVGDPCPSGFRIPTQDELERIANYDCDPSVAGGEITNISRWGKGDNFVWVPVVCSDNQCFPNYSWTEDITASGYAVYNIDDWDTYDGEEDLLEFAKEPLLFFPAAGERLDDTGTIYGVGMFGEYLTSTVCSVGDGAYHVYGMELVQRSVSPNIPTSRVLAGSVRCIMDDAVAAACDAPPATPGAITISPTVIDVGGTLTASVAAVPGATSYIWTLPPGLSGSSMGRTITITGDVEATYPAGTITVKAVNACGTSVARISTDDVIVNMVVRLTTFVNAMYDFQQQTLTTYKTGGTYTVSYQWEFSTNQGGTWQTIPGATSMNYIVPVDFMYNYGGLTKSNTTPGTSNSSIEIFFRCAMTNSVGTVGYPPDDYVLKMLFVRTNSPGYGTLNGVKYLTVRRGLNGTVKGGTIKMALLYLGQSDDGSNADDIGDLYQWGRVADGHEHIEWTKVNRVNAFGTGTSGVYGGPITDLNANGQVNPTSPAYGKFIRSDVNIPWGSSASDLWGNPSSSAARTGLAGWSAKGRANNPCTQDWYIPSQLDWWDMYNGTGTDAVVGYPTGNGTNNTWDTHTSPNTNSSDVSTVTNDNGEIILLIFTSTRFSTDGTKSGSALIWSSTGSIYGAAFPVSSHPQTANYTSTWNNSMGMFVRCVAP